MGVMKDHAAAALARKVVGSLEGSGRVGVYFILLFHSFEIV